MPIKQQGLFVDKCRGSHSPRVVGKRETLGVGWVPVAV